MTDIRQLLERASDVPVPVDVSGDLARGRAAARRGRIRAAGVVAGAVLVAGVVVVGVAVTGDGVGDAPAGFAEDPTPASASPTPPAASDPSSAETFLTQCELCTSDAPTPERTLDADPVDPATLVHTDFFDVPPPPPGWFLVGAQEPLVMMAREGTDAAVTDPFAGRLMLLLSTPSPDRPGPGATPVSYDGRIFYLAPDAATQGIDVQLDDGGWLTVQYPRDAGFSRGEMTAFLAAVRVLPGAMGAG